MMEVRVKIPVNEEEVWEQVIHGYHWSNYWWQDFTYDSENGFLFVKYLGEDDKIRHKKISKSRLAIALARLKAKNQTHCGGNPIDEWDACSGDFILQEHIFGKLVYG